MMVAMSVALRTGLSVRGDWLAMMDDQGTLPAGVCCAAQLGKATKGRLSKTSSLRGKGIFEQADEGGDGLAVAEERGEGEVAGGGEEGDADVAGHPDGVVGHEPPGAILGDDDDVGAGGPALRVEPGGHAADFLHGAGPGPVEELAVVDGLGEERLGWSFALAGVDPLQGNSRSGSAGPMVSVPDS